jgi:hypothetical protein
MGVAPDHLPVAAVRVLPWSGDPEMVGGVVFTGGEPPPLETATASVGTERTPREPLALLAMTSDRIL